MRLLVTRPVAQAAEWVARLGEAHIDAVALPLISIEPAADAAAVQSAWGGLAEMQMVVFVSPNAAEQFMDARPPTAIFPPALLVASMGPGTTRALLRRGVAPQQIVEPAAYAAQFDSEALWARLQERDWRDSKVLIVRGDGGREWLADTLRARGAQVVMLAAYHRSLPRLDAAGQALLRAAMDRPQDHLWFFSSSEAIDNLATLAGPGACWTTARALATHPRIAARAQGLGFGQVTLTRPTFSAVFACIQSAPP